jgi:hypothetical protein
MKRSLALFCTLSILTLAACGSSTSTPAAGGAAGGSTGSPGGSTGSPGGSTGTPTFTRIDVTDDISAATTWYATNVYVIPEGSSVYVNAGLTIQPGTVVKLGADSEFSVQPSGQINATGTALYPIVFTSLKDDTAGGDTNGDGDFSSPGMGDWNRIVVAGNQSTFSYCQFSYGNYGLQLSAKNLTVSNDIFYSNTTGLLASQGGYLGISITNNTFYANTNPVVVNSNYAVDSTNVFHYLAAGQTYTNTFQAIQVDGDINTTTTWSNIEVAYTFNGTGGEVDIDAALTLAPGVVVKFGQGDGVLLNPGSTLNGFATAIFTSLKDDSNLGDSNGDLTATTPGPGDWEGIADIRTSGPTLYLDGPNVLYAVY